MDLDADMKRQGRVFLSVLDLHLVLLLRLLSPSEEQLQIRQP
jgi:hypothetical protein